MKVLTKKSQIAASRRALREKRISLTEPAVVKMLRSCGLVQRIALGDQLKSWDVLESIEFIAGNLKRSDPILDIGAYASEIIVALHKLGFKNLAGADLNPSLSKMPFNSEISYKITDFMDTGFPPNSFKAVTAVSVIEHGYQGERLFAEVSRLLMPGGYFVASFDYWPEKIDTSAVTVFGMDWTIFSRNEIASMIELAASFELQADCEFQPVCVERPIKYEGREYTFGWIVFRKIAKS